MNGEIKCGMSIHGILLSYEKKVNIINTFCEVDEPHWHNSKWKTPNVKVYISSHVMW